MRAKLQVKQTASSIKYHSSIKHAGFLLNNTTYYVCIEEIEIYSNRNVTTFIKTPNKAVTH